MHPFGYVRADSKESAIATVAENFEALYQIRFSKTPFINPKHLSVGDLVNSKK